MAFNGTSCHVLQAQVFFSSSAELFCKGGPNEDGVLCQEERCLIFRVSNSYGDENGRPFPFLYTEKSSDKLKVVSFHALTRKATSARPIINNLSLMGFLVLFFLIFCLDGIC